LLAVKSGFILFIKNYQFPIQINTLERDGRRKSSRRLRRFALGSTSKERPCSAWPGRLSPWTGFCISLLHAFAYCLLRIFVCLCDACCASCHLRPVPHPSLLRQLGRPGKGLTLTLRLVPHPRVPRHIWAGPTKEPEAGAPSLFATATGQARQGTHTHRQTQCKHTWGATTCDVLRQR
jgi:hypothetical protein